MSDRPGENPLPDDADGEALAARYEAAIPEESRAALGQFYTPPALARACCRWALTPQAGDPLRVLDPAAGGGAFVVAALDRLAALGAAPATAREAVTAVDVDGDALSVTRERAGDVETREVDFLALDPDDLGQFDAVVGNPPYVRQEGLDKDDAREHLAALGPDGATPYLDGDDAIDRRSDAYVYFLTNATRFLRPGGRLAMVVPTKWLATRYGESLQRFLLDHYRVQAVVGFEARAFDDALVDAAVLCCVRREESAARRDGEVRFARTAASDADGVAAALQGTGEARTVAVDQTALAERGPGKLAHYLDAPPALVDLLDHEALVPLSELAAVSYGQKTGANACFFLDPDDPVADRFRAPALTSFRDVEGVVLEEGDVADEVLDVHDYVERVLADGEAPSDPAGAVLDAMERDGYAETASYLRRAADDYADRRTCAARRVWFDLGDLPRPAVLHPKFFDERVRVVHNRARAVPSNAIDCLSLREGVLASGASEGSSGERRASDGVPAEPLLGLLNSSLYRAALECWGRAEGGGALQLMTYELQAVPVPDVRALSPAERERVVDAFRAYADGECGGAESGSGDDQQRLDAAVLDALGLAVAPGRVAALRERMVRRRVDGTDGGR
jgi:methylase of polypeptide subunit release factors